MTEFIFQAVTEDSHSQAVTTLLAVPEPEKILISTAFMSEGGLSLLETSLTPVADKTTIIAGIRNGITSAQGCKKAIDIGCSLYAVDTGARNVLFHPKIYFARSASEARIIIGSANLTIGGLNSNIEASISIILNMTVDQELAAAKQLEDKISSMMSEYPEHVFPLADQDVIQGLLDSGRLIDENLVRAPTGGGSSTNRDLDKIPKMKLKTTPVRRSKASLFTTSPQPTKTTKTTKPAAATPKRNERTLVWESNPLTRRDLTIPTGQNTHATGSMLLKKGAWGEDIDHRHYFRDAVFDGLNWQFEKSKAVLHMERAEANFGFIIKDVDYGVYMLRLSHNTLTNTKSYEQRNSMTQIHWGDARLIIALEDLLERTMFIYRDDTEENLFVIEID